MSEQVTVLLFAAARETVGAATVTLDIPSGCTTADLLAALGARYPLLQPYLPSLRVAINGCYARADEGIVPGDEVAVIPPVAGG